MIELEEETKGKNLLNSGKPRYSFEVVGQKGESLEQETNETESDSPKTNSDLLRPSVLHLVTAARVPPLHTQLVKASVTDYPMKTKVVLEPDYDALAKLGVQMDPAVVTIDERNHVVLAIHNLEHTTVKVQPGEKLGALHNMIPVVSELSAQKQTSRSFCRVLYIGK